MANNRLAAIDALCNILNRFPQPERHNLITWACMAVGQAPEPTGLPPTQDRRIKHYFWDLTADDLQTRLRNLVDEHSIAQEVLVKGLIAHLEGWYELCADPQIIDQTVDNSIAKIAELKELLQVPVDDRPVPIPDHQLTEMISQLEENIENRDGRRAQAERTLASLQKEVDRVFTAEFWKSQRFGFEQ